MKKISCSIIIASLIILLIAIGSVCAVSDSDLISDEDDFDNDDEDIEPDDDGDSGDDDSEDLDDEEDDGSDDLDDEDDYEDNFKDKEDDDSEDLDDEDEDETGGYDGEFDGEVYALSASADFDGAKGMGIGAESNLNSDSQGDIPLSPQTGNPIVVLLFSLLFLILIPLRNR